MQSDYIVFVDESGDHSLSSIDEQYPVFVLSFCVFQKDGYIDVLTPAVRRLKFETFGHEMVILHENDIRRRKGVFGTLTMEERMAFMEKLSGLIDACDFTLIGVVIHKDRHKARYNKPEHPYHLALQFGLERLRHFLKLQGQEDATTYVVCEARGAAEDAELELAFRRVCDGENRGSTKYPFKIVIASKKTNSEGLQIADLTARPLGLRVSRPDQENRAFDVLSKKFFTGNHGAIHGNGFKVFP